MAKMQVHVENVFSIMPESVLRFDLRVSLPAFPALFSVETGFGIQLQQAKVLNVNFNRLIWY